MLLLQDNAPAPPLPWQWLQFENAASNCSVNRRIHQTWLRLTTTYVFRSLKDSLRGRSFGCDEEVIPTINDWFELQDKQFFVDGVNSLAHRWEKRVVLEGDYIEKL